MNEIVNDALPDIKSSVDHYNEIPAFTLGKKILDVGSSDGVGAFLSRYGRYFLSNDYLGIDIQQFSKLWMPVVTTDLFDFETTEKYDTILLLHVLEHIPLSKWHAVYNKYSKFVKSGGYIVVNVPYMESKQAENSCEYQEHLVLNIDRRVLKNFCDFDRIYIVRKYIFRENYEGFLKPMLRFFYRIIRRHPLSFLLQIRNPIRIIGVKSIG